MLWIRISEQGMYLTSCTLQWQTIDIPLTGTHGPCYFIWAKLCIAKCVQLWGVKWCFIVILICISLITSGSGHLFTVHWTFIFHLLWNACLCLLASLYFLIFICVSSWSGGTHYSHFMAFLFLVFMMSFDEYKFLIFILSYLAITIFVISTLCVLKFFLPLIS